MAPPLARADRNIRVGLAKVVQGAYQEFARGVSLTVMVTGNRVLATGDGMVGVAQTQVMAVNASGSCT